MTCRCNPSQPCTCSGYATPEPKGVIPIVAIALALMMGGRYLIHYLIGV